MEYHLRIIERIKRKADKLTYWTEIQKNYLRCTFTPYNNGEMLMERLGTGYEI